MNRPEEQARALSPQESWQAIHATMEEARSSMYVAGTATILLLWGVIASVGFISMYVAEALAPDFTADNPWFAAPLWGVLVVAGMVGSAVIGSRAGDRRATGDAVRSAGIRVFLFWIAVAAAAFLVPAAAGLWTEEAGDKIPHVAIGIVALGHVLFGIMHRLAIASVGLGLAAAFFLPSYLAGDAALLVSGASMLAVAALGWAWIRRSGVL